MAELTEIVGTAVQKMESKLECSICMESYKQPKLLPCYHIFCKSPCLERLVVQDRQGQSIKCPTCRHLVRLTDEGVDGLKTDFHIDQLFEIRGLLKTVVESQRKSCGKCKKLPATGFCRDCGRLVCQRCTEMHQTWDDLACHTIVGLNEVLVDATKLLPLKKQVPRCEKHYKMKLKIFCSKCSEVICSDCTIGLHKDHGYDLVQDVFPKHKDEIVSGLKAIEESLNKVKETLKVFDTRAKDIHNRRAKVEADIHMEIDQLHQILDQRRRDLIGSLDLLFQQNLKNLATERDSVEMLHIKMESCLNYAKVGLETGTEGEVLIMKGPLLQRVEQITTEFDPDTIQPRTEANIALVTGGLDNIRQKCQEISVTEIVHHLLPGAQVQKVCTIFKETDDSPAAAIVDLADARLLKPKENVSLEMQSLYSFSTTTTFEFESDELADMFKRLVEKYSHLKTEVTEVTKRHCAVSGSYESINILRDAFYSKIAAQKGAKATTTADSEASTYSNQEVYSNLDPNILALLEKIPDGAIDGVHYDWRTARVLIDKDPPTRKEECICKFQEAYQQITSSRKLKTEGLPIPPGVSTQKLTDLLDEYNKVYSQSVFILQNDPDHCVKIISTSSRQIDQAKVLLSERLAAVTVSSQPTFETEVIILPGDRKLTLKMANIVKENVDMIVNPANEDLLHGGGVAAALNRASKGDLQTYSNQYTQANGPVAVGRKAVTRGGGDLKCKHVVHAVGPRNSFGEAQCKHLLTQVVRDTLHCAEQKDVNSIAFPAISTGIFGVSKELVAECIVDTILTYYFTRASPCLSDIRIVIIDRPTYTPFAHYIQRKRRSPSTKPLIQPSKFTLQGDFNAISCSASPPASRDKNQSEEASSVPVDAIPLSQRPEKTFVWNDLKKISSLLNQVSSKWQAIGRLLGFSNEALDKVEMNAKRGGTNARLERLLKMWISGNFGKPTVSVLVKALNVISGTKDVVRHLLEVYGDKQSEIPGTSSAGSSHSAGALSPSYSKGTRGNGQLVGMRSLFHSQGTRGSVQSGTPFYSQRTGGSGQSGTGSTMI